MLGGSPLRRMVVLLLASLLAQSPAPRAEARRLFEQGEAQFSAGSLPAAEQSFTQSYALLPLAATAWNLARCAEAAKTPALALGWYRRYLRFDPSAADRAQVEASMRSLEKQLAARGVQALTLFIAPAGGTGIRSLQPQSCAGFKQSASPMGLSPSGTTIVLKSAAYVKRFDVGGTGERLIWNLLPPEGVTALAHAGNQVVASFDGTAWTRAGELPLLAAQASGAALSEDGKTIFVGTPSDQRVLLFSSFR